ncbi:MAG: hypothetical protein EOP08_13755 [Proteobacteria bacterium]|nr:MAG: hypothetical protein EOP08_13755 [Pseudomonadota bacterium]
MPGYGYFRADDFVPEDWKPGYQNPAFLRMTEHDGAWMSRIIARIRPVDVVAIVRAGQIAVPSQELAIIDILQKRRMAILRRYLTRLSPVADVTATATGICAVDLGLRAQIAAPGQFAYRVDVAEGASQSNRQKATVSKAYTDGTLCIDIPRTAPEGGVPDGDDSRYRVIRVWNGVAKGALHIHLYDRGPTRGLTVVGLVRANP